MVLGNHISRKYARSIAHIQRTALEAPEPSGACSSAASQPCGTSPGDLRPVCHFSGAVGQIWALGPEVPPRACLLCAWVLCVLHSRIRSSETVSASRRTPPSPHPLQARPACRAVHSAGRSLTNAPFALLGAHCVVAGAVNLPRPRGTPQAGSPENPSADSEILV